MTRLPLALLILTLETGAQAQQKKRVAIVNFDYATVHSSVYSIFGANADVGKGIADLLVDKLVQDGTYSVIERKAIDKIMAEQNFSNSDRADVSSAARLGRLLGVDAIIMGSITQFGRDDKKAEVGGGALGGITGRFGVAGVQRTKSTAVVGITARMVSTDTAEILATASSKGESARSGTGLLGSGGSATGIAGGVIDMRSQNFANTILGEATNSAVGGLARQLQQRASSLPAKTVTIDGLVADVSGDSLILNIGSKAGVKAGDRLQLRRKLREVKDPSTGKVIRTVEEKIGDVVVTEVDELSSVGKFTGASSAKVGDTVRSPQP